MKEKITNAFMKIAQAGNFNQKSGSKSEKQKNNAQYFPPLKFHLC